MNRRPNIELHIEELVLHGFAPGDRAGIAVAMERELARLFTERGLPASWSRVATIDHIDGGSFRVVGGSSPPVVGEQVARAVHGSLQHGGVKR